MSPRRAGGLLVPALLLAAGCAARQPPRPPGPSAPAELRDVGEASWYGRPFHGRRTASGERYDMNELTAAHPSLPFGTRVRVTHLGSGRQVVVRINDRGPFLKGRIIDLSRAAARRLGMIESGVARVRLEILAGAGR